MSILYFPCLPVKRLSNKIREKGIAGKQLIYQVTLLDGLTI